LLILHISCACDQFEHFIAHTFIAAHIAQHHLEHFYTLIGILLKLLHILLSFAFLHFLRGSSRVKGEFLFLPLFVLDESIYQQGGEIEIFSLLTMGEIFLLWESKGRDSQGGETLDYGAFASCVEPFASGLWSFC
jgi:hypothetical protein